MGSPAHSHSVSPVYLFAFVNDTGMENELKGLFCEMCHREYSGKQKECMNRRNANELPFH